MNTKQIITLAVLLGLIALGFWRIPHFNNHLVMIGLISFLVIAHEFGHFLVAKKVGVKVERFGFGLPIGPTLLEKQVGDTTFCFHPVLLGGYVSFPDDDPNSDIPLDSPERFENKPIPQRAAIAVAGVVVNFILGYLIMVLVIAGWGYPTVSTGIQGFVSPTVPAVAAGLQKGDLLLKVDGTKIDPFAKDLVTYLEHHPKQPIVLTIKRHGAIQDLQVIPNEKGKIGAMLSPERDYERVTNPVQIMSKSYLFLQNMIELNIKGIGQIISGKLPARQNLAGPIGIVKMGGEMITAGGIQDGLIVTALISTILAIMNILPIPMLDGGHLLFMAIEMLQGRPLNEAVRERVMQFSFFILVGLMVLILWNDINTHVLGH